MHLRLMSWFEASLESSDKSIIVVSVAGFECGQHSYCLILETGSEFNRFLSITPAVCVSKHLKLDVIFFPTVATYEDAVATYEDAEEVQNIEIFAKSLAVYKQLLTLPDVPDELMITAGSVLAELQETIVNLNMGIFSETMNSRGTKRAPSDKGSEAK
nr:hypothetical protein BaRGS_011473 [Batillaria attramentaria]